MFMMITMMMIWSQVNSEF